MKPRRTTSPRKKWLILIAVLAALALALCALYQIPWVKDRLEWRLDVAWTYVRSLLRPAGDVPTARADPTAQEAQTTSTPTPTRASAPSETAAASATLTPTPFPTPTSTPIPPSLRLPPPEFDRSRDIQDWNNCGPATLALYLRFYGWGGDQFTISSVVKPIRADRNVNIDELQYYVRTQAGWLDAEYRVGGTLDVLKQIIAAGYPVMIEEAFHNVEEDYWLDDDHWMGHYLLLTGYDDLLKIFIAQDSFYGPDQKVNYVDVDKNWQAFNRVFMIIFPVQSESAMRALLGENWDVDRNREVALAAAQAESEADPENLFAWFNLGTNLTYFEKYTQAAAAYDQAREIGLPQRMLRYQFGPFIAYFNAARNDDLLALTEYALLRTPNSEEALTWHAWALYRAGDKDGAIAEFEKALEAHKEYAEALYGLDFVNTH